MEREKVKNKCLVFLLEGETEVEFYKRLIRYIREKYNTTFSFKIEYKNVKGCGNFKTIALRKFKKDVKTKYGEKCVFIIVFCSDTDVIEFSLNPSINWEKIKKDFEKSGVKRENIIHIEARHSIEDWFLHDLDNILKFLKLKKGTRPVGSNGVQKMDSLFKKANKVYEKGNCSKLVECLDMEKIIEAEKEQLKDLLKLFEE